MWRWPWRHPSAGPPWTDASTRACARLPAAAARRGSALRASAQGGLRAACRSAHQALRAGRRVDADEPELVDEYRNLSPCRTARSKFSIDSSRRASRWWIRWGRNLRKCWPSAKRCNRRRPLRMRWNRCAKCLSSSPRWCFNLFPIHGLQPSHPVHRVETKQVFKPSPPRPF